MSFWKPKWRPSHKTIKQLQKLAERLGLPHPTTYVRLYPGHWQRSAGAWLWYAADETGRELFGSIYPLMAILNAERVSYNRLHSSVELFVESNLKGSE